MTTKIQAVRKEFQEPFRDVVRRFAEDGYSKRLTARILDFDVSQFQKTCKRLGIDNFLPHREQRKECRPGGKGKPKGSIGYKPRTYTDEYLLSVVRSHPVTTYFDDQTGVSVKTIKERFRQPWAKIVRMAHE